MSQQKQYSARINPVSKKTSIHTKSFFNTKFIFGFFILVALIIGGNIALFNYISFSGPEKVSQASALANIDQAWKKTQGLPKGHDFYEPFETLEGDIMSVVKIGKNRFIFKLNRNNLTWENTNIKLPSGNFSNVNIEVSPSGVFYLLNSSSESIGYRYNAEANSWEKLWDWQNPPLKGYSRKNNQKALPSIGVDGHIYMSLSKETLKSSSNLSQHLVLKYNPNERSWTEISPQIPISSGNSNPVTKTNKDGTTEIIKKSNFVELKPTTVEVLKVENPKDEGIFIGVTVDFYTNGQKAKGTFLCDNLPEQPATLIMKLENGEWKGLSNRDKNYNAVGWTCAWRNQGKIFANGDKNKIYAYGGSGQFYYWDENKVDSNGSPGLWSSIDDYSYGDTPKYYFNGDIGFSEKSSRNIFNPIAINENEKITLPRKIEAEECLINNFRDGFLTKDRSLAIAKIGTDPLDKCFEGYPTVDHDYESIGTNAERTLQKKIDINTKGNYISPASLIRGVYVLEQVDFLPKIEKNLVVDTSTYLLSSQGSSEEPIDLTVQPESLVVAQKFENPTQVDFRDALEFSLENADFTSNTKLIKLNTEGTRIISYTNIPGEVYNLETFANGEVAVAGDFGLMVLNPELSKILWSKNLDDFGSTQEVKKISSNFRLDIDKYSENQTLAAMFGKGVYVYDQKGQEIATKQIDASYVEDIAIDSDKNILYVGGFKNANNQVKNGKTFPVQVAYVYALDIKQDMKPVWQTWDYDPSTLDENMADTRIYRLALSPDKNHLYAAGESAGGNTAFRWNGKDLKTNTGINNGPGGFGDLWLAKRSAHLAYLGKINTKDGTVDLGSFNTALLNGQGVKRLNTTNVRGDLVVDTDGFVYLSGKSSAYISGKTTWKVDEKQVGGGYEINDYAGSDGYLLKLDPNLQRHFWSTFSQNKLRNDMIGLATNGQRVALVGKLESGEPITTQNALQKYTNKINDSSQDYPTLRDSGIKIKTDTLLVTLPVSKENSKERQDFLVTEPIIENTSKFEKFIIEDKKVKVDNFAEVVGYLNLQQEVENTIAEKRVKLKNQENIEEALIRVPENFIQTEENEEVRIVSSKIDPEMLQTDYQVPGNLIDPQLNLKLDIEKGVDGSFEVVNDKIIKEEKFQKPVEICFVLNSEVIKKFDPNSIRMAKISDSQDQWEILEDQNFDSAKNQICAKTDTFSLFTLIGEFVEGLNFERLFSDINENNVNLDWQNYVPKGTVIKYGLSSNKLKTVASGEFIDNLIPCTKYYAEASWNGIKIDGNFVTAGCPGRDKVDSFEIGSFTVPNGNSATFDFVQRPIKIAIPENVTNLSQQEFQVQALQIGLEAFANGSLTLPEGVEIKNQYLFDLSVIDKGTETKITEFDNKIKIEFKYEPEDFKDINSIQVINYHNQEWREVPCVNNVTTYTMVCQTDKFSVFGLIENFANSFKLANLLTDVKENNVNLDWEEYVPEGTIIKYGLDKKNLKTLKSGANIENLVNCTKYYIEAEWSGIKVDGDFVTDGCSENKRVDSFNISSFTIPAGGSQEFNVLNSAIKVNIPENILELDEEELNIQIRNIGLQALANQQISFPPKVKMKDKYIYDLSALSVNSGAKITEFDNKIQVEFPYDPADFENINNIEVLNYHTNEWKKVPCINDTTNNIVTCETDKFSPFAIVEVESTVENNNKTTASGQIFLPIFDLKDPNIRYIKFNPEIGTEIFGKQDLDITITGFEGIEEGANCQIKIRELPTKNKPNPNWRELSKPNSTYQNGSCESVTFSAANQITAPWEMEVKVTNPEGGAEFFNNLTIKLRWGPIAQIKSDAKMLD